MYKNLHKYLFYSIRFIELRNIGSKKSFGSFGSGFEFQENICPTYVLYIYKTDPAMFKR